MTDFGPEINKKFEEAKKALDRISEKEKEELKHFLWDLYAEAGMSPIAMREVFNEVIPLIEREEAKYSEEDE